MGKTKITFGSIFANLLSLLALGSVALGVYVCYLFIKKLNAMQESIWEDHNLLGMAGEFIGGTVGPIWALAGVILFFLALVYQKKELELQRIELQEGRKIMESQSRTIAIQQFENTFFQLLNFHIQASDQIRSTVTATNRKKGNPFDHFYDAFKKETSTLKRRKKTDTGAAKPADDVSFEHCFLAVYEGFKNTFQHYLENYKTLLLFVDNKSEDPEFYYDILKSHFTEQEVLIHFYYVLLGAKTPRLLLLANEYQLFEKLNQRAVTDVDPYHLDKLKAAAYDEKSKRKKDRK